MKQERIEALHARMVARRRARERRKTSALGLSCAVLTLCLFLLVFGESTVHSGSMAGLYSGAAMLFDGAGGYVLVAVVAFTAAVIITVSCIRWQTKNPSIHDKDDNHKEEKPHETP